MYHKRLVTAEIVNQYWGPPTSCPAAVTPLDLDCPSQTDRYLASFPAPG
jgi:hypothetical protein